MSGPVSERAKKYGRVMKTISLDGQLVEQIEAWRQAQNPAIRMGDFSKAIQVLVRLGMQYQIKVERTGE